VTLYSAFELMMFVTYGTLQIVYFTSHYITVTSFTAQQELQKLQQQ